MIDSEAVQSTTNVFTVIFSAIAAGLSAKSVFLMRKQLREEIRPQLVMFYRKKRRLFTVRNVGRETAMNPKIKILTQPVQIGKTTATLEEAPAMPYKDEKPICFHISLPDTHGLLGFGPQDPKTHAVLNPVREESTHYRILITYEDISGENIYNSIFETVANGVKHISTRRISKSDWK